MSALKAAILILQEAGGPLHAKVIAQRIFAKGLWQSDGKTPVATISAELYSDIKKKGDLSPLILVGPMTFELRVCPESGLLLSAIIMVHFCRNSVNNYA